MAALAWESIKKEVMNEKLSRRVVHGEKITVAQLELSKDCSVPVHHHENEQISVVLEGALKFYLDGKEILARGGEVVVIPPNVPHNVVALEDSIVIDMFSPIRQDWLTGNDAYLRK
jgi:quercetin dioxygenase-like cupin family protein